VDDLAQQSEELAPLSDEELTALALAADPDAPLADDAVPFGLHLAGLPALPDWYMAPLAARHRPRWQVAVIVSLVATFVVLEALGLCSAYGLVTLG